MAPASLIILLSCLLSNAIASNLLKNYAERFIVESKDPANTTSTYFLKRYTNTIVTTHLSPLDLNELIDNLSSSYQPEFIHAYTSPNSNNDTLFTVRWKVYAKKKRSWNLVWGKTLSEMKSSIQFYSLSGESLKQIDSYTNGSEIYYAAIFEKTTWPFGPSFSHALAQTFDSTYCCESGSRYYELKSKGYHPVSLSLQYDSSSDSVVVSDLWKTSSDGSWTAGFQLTALELENEFNELSANNSMVPFYISQYRIESSGTNESQVLFSYIARSVSDSSLYRIVHNEGRDGFEILCNLISEPPIALTSYFFDTFPNAPDFANFEAYAAVWYVDSS